MGVRIDNTNIRWKCSKVTSLSQKHVDHHTNKEKNKSSASVYEHISTFAISI